MKFRLAVLALIILAGSAFAVEETTKPSNALKSPHLRAFFCPASEVRVFTDTNKTNKHG